MLLSLVVAETDKDEMGKRMRIRNSSGSLGMVLKSDQKGGSQGEMMDGRGWPLYLGIGEACKCSAGHIWMNTESSLGR